MKKQNLALVLMTFLTILMLTSAFTNAQSVDPSLVNVEVGDQFKIEVLKNNIDLEALGVDPNELSSFNFTDVGIEQFNFAIVNETLGKTEIPQQGDVIIVEVSALPTGSTDGAVILSLGNMSQDWVTHFSIGTPVTYLDWDMWEDMLEGLEMNYENASDFALEVNVNNTGLDLFKSTVTLEFGIPEEMSTYVQDLRIIQEMQYNKTNGIMELMRVDIIASTSFGPMNQGIWLERTYVELADTTESSSGNETSNVPGYEFAVFVTTALVLTLVRRKLVS